MRAIVNVCRIGYSFADVSVDIPDEDLVQEGRDGRERPMSPDQIMIAFKEAAERLAGDHSFSEKSAEYQAQACKLMGN